MKLYEIANEYRILCESIDDAGGELTPEVEAALAAIGDALESKADALGVLIREAEAEGDALDGERERLRERAVAADRRADRLRSLLLDAFRATGRAKVKGRLFTFWRAKASRPAIRWAGEGEPPAEFCRRRVELDGNKALAAYRAGTLPDEFEVTTSEFLGMR